MKTRERDILLEELKEGHEREAAALREQIEDLKEQRDRLLAAMRIIERPGARSWEAERVEPFVEPAEAAGMGSVDGTVDIEDLLEERQFDAAAI